MELAGRPRHPSELGNRYESLEFIQVHEEAIIWNLSAAYREAPLNGIWEGTGNVI